MASGRDELEAEINAHVGSWLDTVPEGWGDDFKIGTFALIFEVEFPPTRKAPQERQTSGGHARIIGTSDHRNWVQAGLFRRALIESEAHIGQSAPDDE